MSTPKASELAEDFDTLFKGVFYSLYGVEPAASTNLELVNKAADIADRLLRQAVQSDAIRFSE